MLFFFKQKTAYEMRISDWSSDVCSSDLQPSKDVPSTRLDQIPIAHLSDRHTFACPAILVGGIFALDNRSEVQLRLIASLINRQYAISANIDSALDALWIPILQDKGFCTRRQDACAEAPDFRIPDHGLPFGGRAQPIYARSEEH